MYQFAQLLSALAILSHVLPGPAAAGSPATLLLPALQPPCCRLLRFASLIFAITGSFKDWKRREERREKRSRMRKRRKGRALPSHRSSLLPQTLISPNNMLPWSKSLMLMQQNPSPRYPCLSAGLPASPPLPSFWIPHLKCNSKPLQQNYPGWAARENPMLSSI